MLNNPHDECRYGTISEIVGTFTLSSRRLILCLNNPFKSNSKSKYRSN